MGQAERSRVGGYRILRPLAVGGMAEIFLAQLEADHGFTKQVVLKRVLPALAEDPKFVEMFVDEARVAAHLNHPNIAQVFDIGRSEGRPYYAMEYVHGPDLRAVAKRMDARGEGPDLDLVIGIAIGVAAGLAHAHEARDESGRALEIVHRDVTPSNVVVTYSGVAKLLDFGVAKASLAGRESTGVGVIKGKLAYMSPEQIDTSVGLDGRSDVFSLGVVLWELTTLHRLFRFPTPMETMRRISNEDAPLPSSVVDNYPPQLEAIVMRALARDPDARYPDAAAFQRDLELFAAEQRMVVSASQIAHHMGELFAEELAAEREQLEREPRETTDSNVFSLGPRAPSEPDEDGPTRVFEGGSASLPTMIEPSGPSGPGSRPTPLAEPTEPSQARAVGLGPWIGLGLALLVLLASLGLLAFGLGRDPAPADTDREATPAAAPERPAEPLSPSAPPASNIEAAVPAVEVEAEVEAEPPAPPVEADPSADEAPTKKKRAKKAGKRSGTKAKAAKSSETWNKNSLALPD